MDITADAVPGETLKGVISSILVAGTTANGSTSYPVTVRIDDMGELLPGMNATAKITTASVKNVLAPAQRRPRPGQLCAGDQGFAQRCQC